MPALRIRTVRLAPALLVGALLASAQALAAGPPASGSAAPAPRPAAAPAGASLSPAVLDEARSLRDRGLRDDVGYEVLRSLTTEVGPRAAGTAGDARAVAWALAKLRSLGFTNVHAESVYVPHWIRGEARAEITAPWPQSLVAVALGGSVPTPAGGLEGEVVPVTSLDELKLVPPERVKGRIVFFTGRMERTRDGQGYSRAVAPRGTGAAEAAKLGAVAMVMRSAGTSTNRIAHTGAQRRDNGVPPIPALALSNPDADMVEQQLASGKPVRIRLAVTSQWADSVRSANVIGEIPGRGPAKEYVILGAHLDSWDLGTGAHDDAAGVAIVTAAARLIGELKPRPRRTIRVVLFANEEFGLSGARAYSRLHAAEADRYVLGMESDLGAFRLWGMSSRVPLEYLPLIHAIHSVIEPLGVQFTGNEASGDADVGQLRELGVPVVDLRSDAAPYFDLHHTANDTFDKVDPQWVRQNVAAFAAVAYLGAEVEGGFGRAPKGAVGRP